MKVGVEEQTLTIFFYSGTRHVWIPMPTVVDPINQLVISTHKPGRTQLVLMGKEKQSEVIVNNTKPLSTIFLQPLLAQLQTALQPVFINVTFTNSRAANSAYIRQVDSSTTFENSEVAFSSSLDILVVCPKGIKECNPRVTAVQNINSGQTFEFASLASQKGEWSSLLTSYDEKAGTISAALSSMHEQIALVARR
jgi:hypothetical protein